MTGDKMNIVKPNRKSEAYMFTVTDLTVPSRQLELTKRHIKISNGMTDQQYRVCVKYRLGKNSPFAHLYRGRHCYSVMKAHAAHADVYVYEKN
jgi:hypothetical protein